MRILIVSEGLSTSQKIKSKIDTVADHYETVAISIEDIKSYLDYDVVITPNELSSRVVSFYPNKKIKLLESFQHMLIKAIDSFMQS